MSPPPERMESARTACFSEPECIRLSRGSRRDSYFKSFHHREHRGTQRESDLLGALAKLALFRHNTRRTLVAKSYSPHAKNLARSFLDCRQRARSAGAGHHRITSRRADQCPLAGRRRGRDLRRRISLLQQFYFRQSAGARSPARYSGGASRQRPRLRSHQQVGRLRTPFRRHRRPRTAGRPGARRTVRIPARHTMDHRRRCAGWLRAGFCHPVVLGAPRRQIAHRDGEIRNRPRGWRCRLCRRAQHHRDSARRDRAHRRQCAQVESLGNVYHRHDHAHRRIDGRLSAPHPPGKSSRNFRPRICACARRHLRRPVGFRDAFMGSHLHADGSDAGDSHHHLWIRRVFTAGVAAARAPRLPEHLRETRHNFSVGSRHRGAPPVPAHAAPDALCRRQRARVCRNHFSLRVYHHRLRCGQRIPFPDFKWHHAQVDPPRNRKPAWSATAA